MNFPILRKTASLGMRGVEGSVSKGTGGSGLPRSSASFQILPARWILPLSQCFPFICGFLLIAQGLLWLGISEGPLVFPFPTATVTEACVSKQGTIGGPFARTN